MPITPVDRIKIAKFMKETPIGKIYYLDLCDTLGKREKISDIEFLEFFTEAVVKEFRKEDKISMKQLSKYVVTVESFLKWVHEAGSEVDEKVLDSIRNFENYYDEYLNRTNFDIDLEFTDGCLASVINKVNELYPCEEKSESVVQYLNEIDDLKKQLAALTREYEGLTGRYDYLSKEHEKKSQSLITRSDELARANQTVISRDKTIGELEGSIEELSGRITELETLLGEANGELDIYKPFKEQYEEAAREIVRLKGIIEERTRIDKENMESLETDERLLNLMYMHLINGKSDINGLINYIRMSEGTLYDRSKISSLLAQLKSKINISASSFSINPSYQIVPPRIIESEDFNIDIPFECECYDILLVSDFHLKEFDSKTLTGFDVMNNYCVNNNIHLVLNLGDFFDGVGGSKSFDYTCAKENRIIVEKAISVIPHADGVYHAVLGGNHDKNVLKYGFDPIELLATGREDFINLGYNHASIVFNGFQGVIGQFDIHHPQTFNFPIDFGPDGIDTEKLNIYLNRLYSKIRRDRDSSYIDIFGHTHKRQFNYPESYCFIPSYFEGKNKRGACHLKVFFDSDSNIKYMLFMPLSYVDKLIRTDEIVYKKILTR